MPLTDKGQTILANMERQYGEKKRREVFYASKAKGTVAGVDAATEPMPSGIPSALDRAARICDRYTRAQECG